MFEIMSFTVLCVLFLLCFRVSNLSGASTCRQKKEGYVYITLRCSLNTQFFPVGDSPITNLECLDCNIPVLNQETILKNFVGNTFNLSSSNVQVISANVLSEFTNKTKRFFFENNKIDYIAPEVFSHFSQLEEINFRNSKISHLPAGVLNRTFVTKLTLSENSFSAIDHVFEGLKVTRLNLSSNRIREIATDTFSKTTFIEGSSFPHRQHLDLANNMIEKLHPGSFKCFDEDNCVNILELKNNQLTKIKNGTFLDNRHLNELSLCNNFIHHLESNSFRGLTNLKSLTLRNNRIEIIPVSLFEDLQQLNTLDLSENFISSLQLHAFSGLTALEILNISHNNLETFTPTYLFPLGQLTDLDISDVKVHRLDLKEIMRHNSKLRNIILNDNFWKCNDLLDFYTEMNKFGGFSSPTQHYGVPNLHGIACSPRELDTYNDFTFAKFLKIVSTDAPLSDWFNFSPPTKDEQDHTMKYLRNIHGMFIFVLFSIVVLITCYVIKLVMRCLYDNNIVKFNRLSFLYLPGQRNVQVCS